MKKCAFLLRWFGIVALLLSTGIPSFSQFFPAANAPVPNASEDLSTPSLVPGSLRAASPILVEADPKPTYTSEWVTVQWRGDDPIYLYVTRPAGVAKPPVALYLYDYPEEADIFRDDDWCSRVTADGYAAVGFVPALTGHRYHSRPMKEWFVSELQESLAKSAHDVQMVLNYLSERGDLDVTKVGVFGVGAGGAIAVLAASADSRIKALDLIDPWGDWPAWLAKSDVVPDNERQDYLKPAFLERVASLDPVGVLPKLGTAKIRFTALAQGSHVPAEATEKMKVSLPARSERRTVASADALDLTAENSDKAFAWLKAQLRTTETKEAVAKK